MSFDSFVLLFKWTPLKELSAVTAILYGHWRPHETQALGGQQHTHTHTPLLWGKSELTNDNSDTSLKLDH